VWLLKSPAHGVALQSSLTDSGDPCIRSGDESGPSENSTEAPLLRQIRTVCRLHRLKGLLLHLLMVLLVLLLSQPLLIVASHRLLVLKDLVESIGHLHVSWQVGLLPVPHDCFGQDPVA
jgi:hypothetical protein